MFSRFCSIVRCPSTRDWARDRHQMCGSVQPSATSTAIPAAATKKSGYSRRKRDTRKVGKWPFRSSDAGTI